MQEFIFAEIRVSFLSVCNGGILIFLEWVQTYLTDLS